MVNALFGIKKNMTSVYDSRGRRVGATIVALAPNVVTQIKNADTDGYMAIQLGTGSKKSVKKPQQGHLKKASASESTRFLKEVRVEATDDVVLGQQITASEVFHAGDLVKVQGVSKGKGFQGTVRRHGFHGGPKTHGQSDRHRAPGSIGQGTTPGRVYKGKKMSGHMGVDTVSIKSLEVIKIDRETDEVIIKGGVPGPIGGLLKIYYQGQVKGYVAPVEEPEEIVEVDSAQVSGDSTEEVIEAQAVDDTPVTEAEEVADDETVDEVPADAEDVVVEEETEEAPVEAEEVSTPEETETAEEEVNDEGANV